MTKYSLTCILYESKEPIVAGFEKNKDALVQNNKLKITEFESKNKDLTKTPEDEAPYFKYAHDEVKKLRDEKTYPYYTFKCTVTGEI